MSHFTKVETKLKDLQTIIKAINRMDLTCVVAENGQRIGINGLEKQAAEADLEIKTGCAYSVGVQVRADGNCELVADWWAVETFTGRSQKDFIDNLTREYAYVTVMDRINTMGYSVVTEEESLNKEIRVVVRKWA